MPTFLLQTMSLFPSRRVETTVQLACVDHLDPFIARCFLVRLRHLVSWDQSQGHIFCISICTWCGRQQQTAHATVSHLDCNRPGAFAAWYYHSHHSHHSVGTAQCPP